MYERYVELRDKKGVTDYRVSEDTGITRSTFTDWKNGRSQPKVDKLKILADYFGVSIEYFLEWEMCLINRKDDEMYIPEFACGVATGDVVEMIILIILSARSNKKKK